MIIYLTPHNICDLEPQKPLGNSTERSASAATKGLDSDSNDPVPLNDHVFLLWTSMILYHYNQHPVGRLCTYDEFQMVHQVLPTQIYIYIM